jgi:hypothetical protein
MNTEITLIAQQTSILSQIGTWDIILVVGALAAAWMGFRTSGSIVGGVVRSVFFMGVWALFIFLPLMFVGSLLGFAGEVWVNR